jgi:anti-sigma regulatory factor (Ser/Thr protein kinase)
LGSFGKDGGLMHLALFHDTPSGYIESVVRLLAEGASVSVPTIVAAPRDRFPLLARSLGGSPAVRLVDARSLEVNPGRLIPYVHRCLDESDDGLRLVVDANAGGHTAAHYEVYACHHALLNDAFRDEPLQVLCANDVDALPATVVEDVRHAHPDLELDGRVVPNAAYRPTDSVVRQLTAAPLPEPPEDAEPLTFRSRDLTDVRERVGRWSRANGLAGDRSDDLVLAISELCGNSILHGGGTGQLRLWVEDDELVGEVTDTGRLADAMVGLTPPTPTQRGGRGLWLTNLLCDLVQRRSSAGGTITRLSMGRHDRPDDLVLPPPPSTRR